MVWFYGLSTLVGYLMQNPVYTYMLNMIYKHILLIIYLNEPELIFYSQLNGFKYFYQTQIILFTVYHWFTHSKMIKQFYF